MEAFEVRKICELQGINNHDAILVDWVDRITERGKKPYSAVEKSKEEFMEKKKKVFYRLIKKTTYFKTLDSFYSDKKEMKRIYKLYIDNIFPLLGD